MKSQTVAVNINEADFDTLAALPGIGPTLADRIIQYRQEKGLFQSISELAFIQGISGAMVNDISEMLTIGEEVDQETPEEDDSMSPESQGESTLEMESEVGEPDEGGEEPERDEEEVELTADIVIFDDEPVDEEFMEMGDTPALELEEAEEMEDAQELPEEVLPEESEADTGISEVEEAPIAASTQVETRTAPRDVTPQSAAGRGCSIQTALLGGLLGGLLGLGLAVLFLLLINGGSLRFADAESLNTLESETNTQIKGAQESQVALDQQIQELEVLLQEMVGELDDDLSTIATSQADLNDIVNDTGIKVDDLGGTVEAVEEEIVLVVEAAEDFRLFLSGLRELLTDLAETPEVDGTSTIDEGETTGTMTPTSVQNGPGAEATRSEPSTVTSTPRPTRTPRPTATPIGTRSGGGAQTPKPTSTP